jgi:hypothetical protein
MATRPSVFLLHQNPQVDNPAHHTSLKFCLRLVAASFAKWLGSDFQAVQILVNESWLMIKDRFRAVSKAVPVINPVGYHTPCFMTSYPPTAYESDAKERRARLWMGAKKF